MSLRGLEDAMSSLKNLHINWNVLCSALLCMLSKLVLYEMLLQELVMGI